MRGLLIVTVVMLLITSCSTVEDDQTLEILTKLEQGTELTHDELRHISEITEKKEEGQELTAAEEKIISGDGLTACRLGQKWCCTDEDDCDNLATNGDVYICNERYNWELFTECDGACVDGTCNQKCGECPPIHQPQCDGKLIFGGYDNCGCEKSSVCEEPETTTPETITLDETYDCGEGYTLTRSPMFTASPEYYCKTNKEFAEFEPCTQDADCKEGFYCVSPDREPKEYRCVPTEHYKMSCGCEPDGPCWCS